MCRANKTRGRASIDGRIIIRIPVIRVPEKWGEEDRREGEREDLKGKNAAAPSRHIFFYLKKKKLIVAGDGFLFCFLLFLFFFSFFFRFYF